MSFVADGFQGILGNPLDLIGDLTGANAQAEAAERAAGIQAGSSAAGIAENRRQFEKLVQLMAPFVTSGTQAIGAQGALIGLGGADAQRTAIAQLEQSPQFSSLVKQGENALLQNASATGGLRGGNIQSALAQFRPQILSSLIESQYSKLGGLSQMGQAAAAGEASAGMSSASSIADLLTQQGAAQAGGVLAAGGLQRQQFQDALGLGRIAMGAF